MSLPSASRAPSNASRGTLASFNAKWVHNDRSSHSLSSPGLSAGGGRGGAGLASAGIVATEGCRSAGGSSSEALHRPEELQHSARETVVPGLHGQRLHAQGLQV